MLLLLLSLITITQALPQHEVTGWEKNQVETFDPSNPPPTHDSNPEGCVCVPYYQCRNGVINEAGVGLMQPRMSTPCKSDNQVCCNRPQITSNTTPSPPKNDKCGLRKNNNVGDRLSLQRSNQAEFSEFPWIAAILDVHRSLIMCAGSLIHPQVVLTAAHCVRNPTEFVVRLGEWDFTTENEPQMHQDRRIVKIVQHPNFNVENMSQNLALLFLESPVTSAPNIGTICLPELNDVFMGSCFVAGWSYDHYETRTQSLILKKSDFAIFDHATCEDTLRNSGMGYSFVLHWSFMCAGGKGENACMGNGGGPLMCPHPQHADRYTLAGVASWSISCRSPYTPAVFTNVENARKWIDDQLAANLASVKN